MNCKVAHITTVDLALHFLLLNQLRSLQQEGYDVVGISSPGENIPAVEAAGIRHISVPMTRSFTPLADLASLWKLYCVMRRERFTLVHTHTPKAGLLGQLAARAAGVPIVVNTIHGFYFHDKMSRFWRRFYIVTERISALFSDVVLSQNSEDIQTAIREGICAPEKVKFLGNGIDLGRFDRTRMDDLVVDATRHELGIPKNSLVIGFVGRLVREKGVLELLQSLSLVRLRVPNIHCLFVGPIDAEKRDALTSSVAEEYGVADICHFVGLRHDMPVLYAMMDVFVLASHREGFPRVPMEASAMQVPCIVTDIRGCRETVEHGRNGLLVPANDVQTLANAMIELLSDKERAKRMGEAGRRIAVERFDERIVFGKVKAEYQRLLSERRIAVPEKPCRTN